METFIFKEKEIRQAGLANDSSFANIRKQLNELTTLINSTSKERSQRLQKEEQQKKINSLKVLSVGTLLFLVSNNWKEVPYGTGVFKVKDGRKYMTCETPIGKFNVPYSWLNPVQPNESDIETNRQVAKAFRGLNL